MLDIIVLICQLQRALVVANVSCSIAVAGQPDTSSAPAANDRIYWACLAISLSPCFWNRLNVLSFGDRYY